MCYYQQTDGFAPLSMTCEVGSCLYEVRSENAARNGVCMRVDGGPVAVGRCRCRSCMENPKVSDDEGHRLINIPSLPAVLRCRKRELVFGTFRGLSFGHLETFIINHPSRSLQPATGSTVLFNMPFPTPLHFAIHAHLSISPIFLSECIIGNGCVCQWLAQSVHSSLGSGERTFD